MCWDCGQIYSKKGTAMSYMLQHGNMAFIVDFHHVHADRPLSVHNPIRHAQT